jgi:hypothetical protein
MIRTLEAAIDERAPSVCWRRWNCSRRALVTILDEEPRVPAHERALLSEAALAEDWSWPQEDVVSPSAGAVLLVPFPFSDLTQSRLRPAVVRADAGKGDRLDG